MYMTKAGVKIRSQKDRIIKMYEKLGWRILDIANKYHVTESTMYKYFYRWGVEITRGLTPYRRRGPEGHNGNNKSYCNKPMKISPELQAQRAVNQKTNNDKIQFIKNASKDSRESRWIHNICYKTYI